MSHAKRAAALAALEYVKPGMKIGLGTGSTTVFFIEALGQKHLDIQALPTSKASEALAKKWDIPLLNPDTVSSLDLTVDGADEVDSRWRMIKGGGGALLREKITAALSKRAIYIVDESKVVERLGKHSLPIEVLPWAKEGTKRLLAENGFNGRFRPDYLSDNQNLIFDIRFDSPMDDPEEVEKRLKTIPGILATGLFFNLASELIVGYSDGSVKKPEPPK